VPNVIFMASELSISGGESGFVFQSSLPGALSRWR